MNIKDKIESKPIQPNDPRGFAGFDINGLIKQTEPIAQRESISIVKLKSNVVYEIDMSTHIGHDLLITGLSVDIVSNDNKQLQPGNERISYNTTQVIIQLIDRFNKRVTREIVLPISSNVRNVPNDLILLKDGLYRIKLNQDVHNISVTGVPVILNETAIIHDLPVIEI